MKPACIAMGMLHLVLALVAKADRVMEVRLLHVTGVEPNARILEQLVEDPGAQATGMLEIPLRASGATDIREVTPYRYASEYARTGDPRAFETKDLGLVGTATVENAERDEARLTIDLANTFIRPPRIYEVDNVHVFMPAFTRVDISEEEVLIPAGEWRFIKSSAGESSYFWAIRLKNG